MKGNHRIVVANRFVKFDFTLHRNITIIQGDSATGKSTLLNMLETYSMEKESSGIEVSCDVPFFVYRPVGSIQWKKILELNEGSIVFIEEDYDFVSTNEFAEYVEHSDCYYVIVTREALEGLPYSVSEIYCIKESGRYGTTMQVYNVFENVYKSEYYNSDIEISCVITEDSKSGYQFWNKFFENKKCISAYGKSNIIQLMKENINENMIVIVDGAAFGSQMRKLTETIKQFYSENCFAFVPESFEWVLLKSDVIPNIPELKNILDDTANYVDSKEYMSWERFYSAFIIRETEGTPYQYTKKTLNEYYLGDRIIKKVVNEFPVLGNV